MVNLGFGSHVFLTRLTADTVQLRIHLESAADNYYGAAITEVLILLNETQFQILRREVEKLKDPINEQRDG